MKRALSLLLALSLCLGMLPGNVWAEEAEGATEAVEVIEVQEETTQPEEPETMETEPENEETEEVMVPEETEAEETEPEAVEETEEYQEDTGDVVASGTCGDNLTWVLDVDGVLTISGSGEMWDRYSLNGEWDTVKVETVVLEQGVTSIGELAFEGCSSLINITIPEGVTSIGVGAFMECSNLNSVTIPEGVTSINESTFSECVKLSSVIIPESVTRIEGNAFFHCYKLSNVRIPNGVTSFGEGAFYCCGSLTSIIIPNSVCNVGIAAFEGCSNLKSVVISERMTDIADETFFGCNHLNNVTIPEGVTSIGNQAFSYCSSLTSIAIPESMNSIDVAVFSKCDQLKDIYYGGTTQQWEGVQIGDGNANLTNAKFHYGTMTIHDMQYVPDKAATCTGAGNKAYYFCKLCEKVFRDEDGLQETTILAENIPAIGHTEAVDLGVEATCIIPGKTEGKHCSVCGKTLVAQEKISALGHDFVDGSCTRCNSECGACGDKLRWEYEDVTEKLTISGTGDMWDYEVKWVSAGVAGTSAPWDDFQVSELVLEDGITRIGDNAFYYCDDFKGSLDFPESLTSVGACAFYNCSGLTGNLILPSNVQYVGSAAFYFCTGFTGKLTLPKGLRNIQSRSFGQCKGFTGVLVLLDELESIGEAAFLGCSGLSGNLLIPKGVQEIGASAFGECTGLTSVELFDSLKVIKKRAFSNCRNLLNVRYRGTQEQWDAITIEAGNEALLRAYDMEGGQCGSTLNWSLDKTKGILTIYGEGDMWDYAGEKTPWEECSPSKLVIRDGITHVGTYAFANCETITGDLSLPNSIESIGCNAFYGCRGFDGKLTLPDHLKEIADNVFWNCKFTGNLILPDTVESIGDGAFYGCTGLEGNLVLPNNLKNIGESAFYECIGFSGNLILPNSLQMIGKAAFCGCSGFSGDLILPKGLQRIRESTFQRCDGFAGKIMLPRSVTYIANLAFSQSSGFSAIEFYPSLDSIGYRAFLDCTGLTDVYFHGTQEQWDQLYLTEDNEPLYSATLHLMADDAPKCGDNLEWDIDEITGALLISGTGAMYDYDEEKNVAPWKDLPVKSLTMRGEITYIGRYAFAGLTELAGRLSIPYTVDEIGDYAFYNCSGLTGNLYLRGDLYCIGESAFETCSGFDGKLVLPKELNIIGARAFYGCAGFTGNLTFPNQTVDIGSEAFAECRGFIGDLIIPEYVGGIADGAFRFCSGFSGRLKLPSELTGIGEEAFLGCSGFTGSLELPEGLNGIGYGAFAYCRGFTGDLKIPDNVNNIEEYTFASCTGLSGKIVLPRNLDIIGMYAFRGCKNITSIEMYDSVDTIESDAFEGCDSLTDIYYAGTLAQWNKINGHEVLDGKRLHLIYSISYKNVPEEVENPNPTMGESGKVLTLQPLTRSGYKFIGWFDAPEAGKTVTTIPAGNTDAIILYAKWVERGCTITFDGNGGTEGETEAIWAPWDTSVSLPESTFIRPGYTFTAWNTQSDGKGKTYAPGDMVANLAEEGTVTLYAQWTPNTYTARFLPGAVDCKGTTKDMTKLTNGKSYTVPRCGYTRTGYTFAGWKMGDSVYTAGNKFIASGAGSDGVIVFTAQWKANTYTVHFNANKGTGKMLDQKGILYGEATELSPCAFTRKGYQFTGWNTKANGTGETVDEALNLTAVNKGTVTLYAQWEGEPYDVTFHFGEEIRTQTLHYGTAEALDGNPFENPGYTFKCWTTQENGKGKSYKDGAKVTNLTDRDLYAQWTANKYTVVFHSNLAKDTTRKQTLTYDGKETALTANSFSWKGHAFQGWAEAGDAAEPDYTNKEKVWNLTTEKTIDLYAVWKVNEYTVVFDPNGAEGEEITQDMTYDVPAELEANRFERQGYTFQGWSTTAKGKAVHRDGKEVKNLTDKDGVTLRLYAVWAPTSYMVSFEPGEGATGTMKPVKMTYGKTYTLTGVSFKRANYTFARWWDAENQKTYANKAKVSDLRADGGTVTLVAQWELTEFAITYKNLSTWEKEDLLTSYNVLTEGLPGIPSRPGCEFGGWFLDSGCKKPFSGFENIAKPGKLTLYPKWVGTPSKYTLHFAPGAEDVTGKMADKKNLVCGKDYTLANNAFKRPGWQFAGWEIGSVTLDNKAKFSNLPAYLKDFVSGNTITLTAKWVKNTAK